MEKMDKSNSETTDTIMTSGIDYGNCLTAKSMRLPGLTRPQKGWTGSAFLEMAPWMQIV